MGEVLLYYIYIIEATIIRSITDCLDSDCGETTY